MPDELRVCAIFAPPGTNSIRELVDSTTCGLGKTATVYMRVHDYIRGEGLNRLVVYVWNRIIMILFSLTALLVLVVQHAYSQELGEIYNVTVEQGVPKAIKYTIDTRNHTVQASRAVPGCYVV